MSIIQDTEKDVDDGPLLEGVQEDGIFQEQVINEFPEEEATETRKIGYVFVRQCR